MNYLLHHEDNTPATVAGVAGFKTISEVRAFIDQHLEVNGLDWRVGYIFKSRRDAKPLQIIVKKTGKRLIPR